MSSPIMSPARSPFLRGGAMAPDPRANRILASLEAEDLQRWQPALKSVHLARGQSLPPNQAFVVTTKRVFMCTAGTWGLCRWAMTETPLA